MLMRPCGRINQGLILAFAPRSSAKRKSADGNRSLPRKPLTRLMHLGHASCVPNLPRGVAVDVMTSSPTADTALTLPAETDRPVGSIATDLEQLLPRGWSFAARTIVGEVGRR